ncbi:hypothetical protein [Morganella morganii]
MAPITLVTVDFIDASSLFSSLIVRFVSRDADAALRPPCSSVR